MFLVILFVIVFANGISTKAPEDKMVRFSEEAFFKSLARDNNFQKLNEEEKHNLISHALMLIDSRKQEERLREAEKERLQNLKIQKEKEARFQQERKIIKELLLKKMKSPIMYDFFTFRY